MFKPTNVDFPISTLVLNKTSEGMFTYKQVPDVEFKGIYLTKELELKEQLTPRGLQSWLNIPFEFDFSDRDFVYSPSELSWRDYDNVSK